MPRGAATVAALLVMAGAVFGLGISRLSPSAAIVVVTITVVLVMLGLLLGWQGTRGLSSLALYIATFTLGMMGVRLSIYVALSDVFMLAAGLILLPWLAVNSEPRLVPLKRLTIGTGLIVAGGLVGTFYATSQFASVLNVVRFGIASTLLPVLFALWNPTLPELRRIAWLWVGGVTVSALVGFLEQSIFPQGRADGLTTHPNHLSMTCVMAAGPAIALTLQSRGIMRLIGAGCCFAILGGVIFSGSRAGLLGFVMMLLAMAVLGRRRDIAKGIALGAILLIGLVFTGVIRLPEGNALGRLLGTGDYAVSQGTAASDAERREVFRIEFNQAMQHPFTGVGFERALAAHDIYLQIWVSAGFLGIAGFLTIVYTVLSGPVRAFLSPRIAQDQGAMLLLLGFSAGYFGYLVMGVFANALWDRYVWITPAMVAVLTPHAFGAVSARRRTRQALLPATARGWQPKSAPVLR